VDWPHQARPWSNESRRLWNRYLDSITSYQNNLKIPLGQWTNTKYRTWRCYYHSEYQTIFLQHGTRWQEYDISQRDRRSWRLKPHFFELHQDICINDMIPTIYDTNTHSVSPPTIPHSSPVKELPPITEFRQFITTLPDWEKDLLNQQ
jgi:hypothetical protein